jgi:CRP/FNR family transcriptional regulator
MKTTGLIGIPHLDRPQQARAKSDRQRRQLAVLLPELDSCKAGNARLGRAAGDRQSLRITERPSVGIQRGNLACRCGSGEFVLPLPEVDYRNRDVAGAPEIRARIAEPPPVGSHAGAAAPGNGVALQHGAESAPPDSPWKLTDFCLSAGLDENAEPRIEQLLTKRLRVRKGEVLYRVGDEFHALHAIRAGSCKTVLLANDGQDQVAGYHMAGEIIGLDGIGTDTHECEAIALEDMEICPLPFDQIETLARLSEQFGRNLHKLLSLESARARNLMIVLGTMRAEQRLAMFLLDLSQRYRARGYSSCEFVLRLKRKEIGSYLGLKLETVSRLFSRFQRAGMIQVNGPAVRLLDRVAVSQIVNCSS